MEVPALIAKLRHPFATRQQVPPGHVLIIRSTHEAEDELGLIEVTTARQDGLSFNHLAKNTPETTEAVTMNAFYEIGEY